MRLNDQGQFLSTDIRPVDHHSSAYSAYRAACPACDEVHSRQQCLDCVSGRSRSHLHFAGRERTVETRAFLSKETASGSLDVESDQPSLVGGCGDLECGVSGAMRKGYDDGGYLEDQPLDCHCTVGSMVTVGCSRSVLLLSPSRVVVSSRIGLLVVGLCPTLKHQ